jgi:hypothetical protein
VIRSPRRQALLAGAAYLAWALVLSARLLPHLMDALPGDAGDPLLNAAILEWNAQHIPLTAAWWNFPAFAPVADATAFTEHLLGFWLLTAPVIWISGSPILAYNIAFIVMFAASGTAMFLLARYLTGSASAAFVAGLMFAFPLYAAVQVPHLQVLATGAMPICLLALHKYLDTNEWRWLVAASAAWLVTALFNGYFLVFFGVVLGSWTLWYLARPSRLRQLIGVAIALAMPVVVLAPLLLKYVAVHRFNGFIRPLGEVLFYSGDIASLAAASDRLWLWSWLRATNISEAQFFPGVTVAVLAIAGVLMWPKPGGPYPPAMRRIRTGLVAIAIVTGLVSLLVAIVGPIQTDVAGIPISLTRPFKSFSVALSGMLLLALTSRRMQSAWSRADHVGFYAVVAALTWLAALGPQPRLFGETLLYRGPYDLLVMAPGIGGLRVPARFWVMTTICLSVLAAFGCRHLLASRLARHAPWVMGAVVVAFLAESFMVIAPAAVPTAERGVTLTAVAVDLPLGEITEDIAATYRAVVGGHRTANGYSGFEPPHYAALVRGLSKHDISVLTPLRRAAAVTVTYDVRNALDAALLAALKEAGAVPDLGVAGLRAAFTLPATPSHAALPRGGSTAPIARLSASTDEAHLAAVLDDDLFSRWDGGLQRDTHEIVAHLDRPQRVAQLVLELGPFTRDFPTALECALSEDGKAWTIVWRGAAGGLTVEAALVDPARIPITIDLGNRMARMIRVRQIGRDDTYHWSIATLRVIAA